MIRHVSSNSTRAVTQRKTHSIPAVGKICTRVSPIPIVGWLGDTGDKTREDDIEEDSRPERVPADNACHPRKNRE